MFQGFTPSKFAYFLLDSNRSATSTLNRFSALQQSGSLLSSADSERRVPHRYSAYLIIRKKMKSLNVVSVNMHFHICAFNF